MVSFVHGASQLTKPRTTSFVTLNPWGYVFHPIRVPDRIAKNLVHSFR